MPPRGSTRRKRQRGEIETLRAARCACASTRHRPDLPQAALPDRGHPARQGRRAAGREGPHAAPGRGRRPPQPPHQGDRRPAHGAVPRRARRSRTPPARGYERLDPAPHRPAARRPARRPDRRRDPRLVLPRAPPLPHALRGPARSIEHHTAGEHDCDKRCGPHVCKPLGTSSVRQIHNLLNGAFTRAVRWRWVGQQPRPPGRAPRTPEGRSRSRRRPTQAAAIATTAWTDPDWGMLVWLAMTTGARRGELCALRWERRRLLRRASCEIGSSIGQLGARVWEKDTKTHQRRRIVLDAQTLALLRAYLHHSRPAGRGRSASSSARTPSSSPVRPTERRRSSPTPSPSGTAACASGSAGTCTSTSCATTPRPNSSRPGSTSGPSPAGSATAAAGPQPCGSTAPGSPRRTSERPQSLAARLPRLTKNDGLAELSGHPHMQSRGLGRSAAPYQRIAEDLRGSIRCGALVPGTTMPTVKELGARYRVAVGTAQRALALLRREGLIRIRRGQRGVVVDTSPPSQGNRRESSVTGHE